MKNILIDLEFTGLDNTYVKDNEIVQLKLMDADTGNGVCINFKADKPVSLYHHVYCGLDGDYPGETKFSAEKFGWCLGNFAKCVFPWVFVQATPHNPWKNRGWQHC